MAVTSKPPTSGGGVSVTATGYTYLTNAGAPSASLAHAIGVVGYVYRVGHFDGTARPGSGADWRCVSITGATSALTLSYDGTNKRIIYTGAGSSGGRAVFAYVPEAGQINLAHLGMKDDLTTTGQEAVLAIARSLAADKGYRLIGFGSALVSAPWDVSAVNADLSLLGLKIAPGFDSANAGNSGAVLLGGNPGARFARTKTVWVSEGSRTAMTSAAVSPNGAAPFNGQVAVYLDGGQGPLEAVNVAVQNAQIGLRIQGDVEKKTVNFRGYDNDLHFEIVADPDSGATPDEFNTHLQAAGGVQFYHDWGDTSNRVVFNVEDNVRNPHAVDLVTAYSVLVQSGKHTELGGLIRGAAGDVIGVRRLDGYHASHVVFNDLSLVHCNSGRALHIDSVNHVGGHIHMIDVATRTDSDTNLTPFMGAIVEIAEVLISCNLEITITATSATTGRDSAYLYWLGDGRAGHTTKTLTNVTLPMNITSSNALDGPGVLDRTSGVIVDHSRGFNGDLWFKANAKTSEVRLPAAWLALGKTVTRDAGSDVCIRITGRALTADFTGKSYWLAGDMIDYVADAGGATQRFNGSIWV